MYPCAYDKNLKMIQPLVQELFEDDPAISSGVTSVFGFQFWPLVAKPRIRLDQNLACELLLPSGTYVQSFRTIAPAVTKCAMQMGGDHVR
jgi:hypothetical protein